MAVSTLSSLHQKQPYKRPKRTMIPNIYLILLMLPLGANAWTNPSAVSKKPVPVVPSQYLYQRQRYTRLVAEPNSVQDGTGDYLYSLSGRGRKGGKGMVEQAATFATHDVASARAQHRERNGAEHSRINSDSTARPSDDIDVPHNASTSNLFINATKTKSKRVPYQPKNWFTTVSYQPSVNTASARPAAVLVPRSLIADKQPTDVLTLADLQEILTANGYITQSQLQQQRQGQPITHTATTRPTPLAPTSKSTPLSSSSKGVAFPQLSVLSYRDLTIGTTVSGILLGMMLSVTALPDLWLVGGLFMGLWGNKVSKAAASSNVLDELLLAMGRRVALAYLRVYDGINGMWFMYRTGQLSYVYYQRYSQLDDKFALTNKIDSWNARFQQGKLAFDRWEEQNEVGRKLLASVRTVWLVEEQSLRKLSSKKSKYRIIQYGYNIIAWIKRLVSAMMSTLTGGGSSELREVLKGISVSISQQRLDEVVPRLAAAMGALAVLNVVGALFTITPNLLGLLAVVTGLVWPSWVSELRQRVSVLMEELKLEGTRDRKTNLLPTNKKKTKKSPKRKKNQWKFWKKVKRRTPLKEQWGLLAPLPAK